ncbi:multidrug efflux pump subunit AcrA (membrane-fusion protein) [Virgibacillus halotolerans]|uniref:efflux RND transporter periplasmic adaptor subunit n=1 Tax=Virgibacillus halotolerans TaxID=1071053 RepID=UPI0019600F0A|nr:efflux RND transporter periplasmic adaptor subunit [Virgibacillus halotolerans]MBM7601255.1 multidrug efflux pump subunit AcrA (membrane-fusion protein) [Virgibacillus halotolerans]
MKKILRCMTTILLLGILAACNDDDTDQQSENRKTSVETEAVVKDDFIIEKSVYGRISPSSTTPVTLDAPGEIDSLEVENGDKVTKDDLIATLKTPAGQQNIRAPKDGEIAKVEASGGDMVSDEDPLAVIIDMEKLKLEFTVTASVQSLFSKDDTLEANVDDYELKVKIKSIGNMPDDTGLYPIKATAENKDKAILPGMVATILVPEKRVKDAMIVPTEAVVEEDGSAFLFVIKDDEAEKIDVEIEETQSDKTAIKGDVKAGDQVVINGQTTLDDGEAVDVVKGE